MRTELKFGLIGGVLVLVAAFVGYSLWSGGEKPADKPLDSPGKAVVGDSARTVKDESRAPVTPPRDARQPATPPRSSTDPSRTAAAPPRVPQPGDAERPRVAPTPSEPAPPAPSTVVQGAATATPAATPATGTPARPSPSTPTPGPTLPQTPPSTATPTPSTPVSDSRTPTTPGASPATPTNTTINVPPPRTPTTPAAAGSANSAGAAPGGNTVSTHTVSEGETLSSIAKAYYGDAKYWSAIVAANPKINPNRLKLGQVLNMPARADVIAGTVRPPAAPDKREAGGATSRPAPAARPEPRTTAAPAVAPATYKVGRGDTLTSIARNVLKDGNRWREIYELNKDKLASPDDLEEGMELKLPAPRSQ